MVLRILIVNIVRLSSSVLQHTLKPHNNKVAFYSKISLFIQIFVIKVCL